eukprot:evm.model.NODE_36279_length_5402_cov_22.965754.1
MFGSNVKRPATLGVDHPGGRGRREGGREGGRAPLAAADFGRRDVVAVAAVAAAAAAAVAGAAGAAGAGAGAVLLLSLHELPRTSRSGTGR